ncbi:MAG: CAP domain-containing protein [Candidatus Roizmanbacteria bacterium]|nr:CAP domain-containing protein [Candidatus Roizmanbacteria bacterium]
MFRSLKNYFLHFFIPSSGNRNTAKVLQTDMLGLAVAILLLINFALKYTLHHQNNPILGISMHITADTLLEDTNAERKKYGLPTLSYSPLLAAAAQDKATDMFARDYWSHFAPDGTSPWHFFEKNGYYYEYAGENLAKDFNDSNAIVNAWMKSEKHRDNILQSQYSEVGFSIKEGVLQGRPTVLVVQMFGTPDKNYVAKSVPQNQEPKPESTQLDQVQQNIQGAVIKKPVIDMQAMGKRVALAILAILVTALAIDMYVMARRNEQGRVTKTYVHLVLLAVLIAGVLIINPGSIL